MNQLQAIVTRLFRLEKPIDKRLLWVGLAGLALVGYITFSSLGDGSSGTSVASSKAGAGYGSGQGVSTASGNNGTIAGNSIQVPKLYVHVVGLVVHPGLYLLASGSRLADAIFAAGGFARFADEASVNLARLLTDGEQIVVLKLGSNAGYSLGGGTKTSTGGVAGAGQLVNLNRATEPEIESLPGVGPTLAGRIIDWRLANSGFRSKADLQKVAGIGDKLFAQLKDLVTL